MKEVDIACGTCLWLDVEAAKEKRFVCQAFPKGIPDKILSGQHQHRDEYKGDNGIRWKPVEGFEWLDVPERLEDFDRDPSLKEADPKKRVD